MPKTQAVTGYDWKITAKKVGIVAGLGAIAALISWLTSLPLDTSTTMYITMGLAILRGLENFLKHYNK